MNCLDETAGQVAHRIRQLATGVGDPADAEAIMRYADWLEADPDGSARQDLEQEPSPQDALVRHREADWSSQ